MKAAVVRSFGEPLVIEERPENHLVGDVGHEVRGSGRAEGGADARGHVQVLDRRDHHDCRE